PSHSSWIDSEIRVFLLEWEVVEQAIGHQGQNMYIIARAIHQQLYQRGLQKTWHDCLQLLLDMVTLYNRLCHVKLGIEPLFFLIWKTSTGCWATDWRRATSQDLSMMELVTPCFPYTLNLQRYCHLLCTILGIMASLFLLERFKGIHRRC
ncbi:hypothetical protein A6R68_09466, partial [Neotoma lepida]